MHFDRKWLSFILLVFTFSVFLIAYCFMAVVHGNLNVFPVVVHENGKYTLLQTIFYFDHLVREVLIAIMMALSIAIAFYARTPLDKTMSPYAFKRICRNSLFVSIFLMVSVIAAGINNSGYRIVALDFFQFRTRDDLVSYGSHWQFHLLHTAYFLPVSLVIAEIFRRLISPYVRMNRRVGSLSIFWIILFIILTVVFLPSLHPLNDPRYLAHQIREIFTHSLTTLPFALGILLFYEDRLVSIKSIQEEKRGNLWWTGFLLMVSLMIPSFILYRLSAVDILSIAQNKTGIADLLAFHFFEHLMDSILVASLSLFFYLLFVRRLASIRPQD